MDATAQPARALVGTAGWSKPSWKGHFHPIGLTASRALEYTTARIATIELNTTFHGLRSISDFRTWFDRTPPGFAFSVKGHRPVTFDRRPGFRERRLSDFFASGVLQLREKLGPIMWQFDDSHEFDSGYVEGFLSALPRTAADVLALLERVSGAVPEDTVPDLPEFGLRYAVEARHPSFSAPSFRALLETFGVASVLNTAPGRPDIDPCTSEFVYLRLHGSADFFPSGYDDETLERWAERITGWTNGSGCPDGRPRDVFAYFTNREADGWHPPFDAVRLQSLIDGTRNP
jgi:Uncharacterized conserved protein